MGGVERKENFEFQIGLVTVQFLLHMFLSTRAVVLNHGAVRVGGDTVRSKNAFERVRFVRHASFLILLQLGTRRR